MNAEPGGGRILIAWNRGPVSFTRGEDGNLSRHRGAGGLVSGLSPVAGRAHVLWVCAALSDADRAAARAAPDGRIDAGADDGDGLAGASGADASTGVRMLDIPATTFHRAYNSVANSTLWFVHHMLYDTPNRPNFGLTFRREWESFRGYNATFAAALAEGAGDPAAGVRALVQHYHPSVGVHPLGVDADGLPHRAAAADVQAQVAALTAVCGDRKLIVRVDRTELSKNIVRGLLAYRELLITYPEWRGRVTHVALAYPSRHDLPEYREYTASVQRLASEIENEFGADDWDPLLLAVNDDYPRSLAAYRLADVLLVNPIRDGMNLVAKEGPILSDRGCALVLSTEAGAAAELGADALLVNPYHLTGTAQAPPHALTMPDPERRRR